MKGVRAISAGGAFSSEVAVRAAHNRGAQLEGLPGARQVEGAVLVCPHLLIAQGDQGAGNGRLGLGVNYLAVISFGSRGRRRGLAFSRLALFGGGRAGYGFLGLTVNHLGGLGWGRAGNGFLGLAGRGLGVISQRPAGQDQGHHQNEPGQREFLLHIFLFQPAALPASSSRGRAFNHTVRSKRGNR